MFRKCKLAIGTMSKHSTNLFDPNILNGWFMSQFLVIVSKSALLVTCEVLHVIFAGSWKNPHLWPMMADDRQFLGNAEGACSLVRAVLRGRGVFFR